MNTVVLVLGEGGKLHGEFDFHAQHVLVYRLVRASKLKGRYSRTEALPTPSGGSSSPGQVIEPGAENDSSGQRRRAFFSRGIDWDDCGMAAIKKNKEKTHESLPH